MFISIRHKIGGMLFAIMFLLTLFIVSILQYNSYRQVHNAEVRTAKAAIRAALGVTDKWILERMNTIKSLAFRVETLYSSKEDFDKGLKYLASVYSLEKGIYVGFEDGQFIDSTDWAPPSDYDFTQRPWYEKAMQKKRAVFVPPYKDMMTGKQTVTFAAPIYQSDTTDIRGIVAFDVFLQDLNNTLRNIFKTDIDRLFTFKLPDGRLGMLVSTLDTAPDISSKIVYQIANKGLFDEVQQTIGKEKFIIVHGNMPMINSVMVYAMPLTKISRPILIQSILWFVFSITMLWGLLSFARYILGRHIKRIEHINNMAKQIAEGNFDVKVRKTSNDEAGQLADSMNKMVQDLKNYVRVLASTVKEKESIAKELDIAREVQKKALPKHMPQFKGLDIAAKSFPARAVGGDYYDFLFPEKNQIGLVIADAVGKGISASLYMSNVRSAFRVMSLSHKQPSIMLTKINDYISKENIRAKEEMFISYIFGVYDSATRQFTYANAGHCPPLLYRNKTQDYVDLNKRGMPIGIMDDKEYPQASIDLYPGDIVIMYTDGVTEAFNVQEEMFGLDNLKNIIRQNSNKSAQEIINSIYAGVKEFIGKRPQSDDITVLAVKVENV